MHIPYFITRFRHVLFFLRYNLQLAYLIFHTRYTPLVLLYKRRSDYKIQMIFRTHLITIKRQSLLFQTVIVMNCSKISENSDILYVSGWRVIYARMFNNNAIFYLYSCLILSNKLLKTNQNILEFVHVNKNTIVKTFTSPSTSWKMFHRTCAIWCILNTIKDHTMRTSFCVEIEVIFGSHYFFTVNCKTPRNN